MSITGFLKRLFVSICLIVASIVSIGAATLTSNDPNWLGARESFSNTEGNDFWLTFMNNATFDPTSPQYANITFELKVAVSARQQTHVILEVGTAQFEHTVQANETYFFDLSSMSSDVYLLESEGSPSQYKGVHVYTDEPDKNFSCFTYSRVGERGESSRDGTLIIPTNFLGKEYYVQTYPEDTYSSEFAIVATEDNTTVRIKPTFETFGGVAAGSEITLTMNAGDAYLVASRQHTESDTYVDLSGSRICATNPVAVFNGNQQTNMPYSEGGSKDFLSEQTLPIAQWGTDYYLALLGNTLSNVYIITAGYDGTEVHIDFYDGTTHDQLDTVLNAGESLVPYYPDYGYLPYTLDEYTLEATIHCSQPTLCYVYTTSSTSNTILISTRPRIECNFGDPANAMMPAWNHLTKSMNFFDHDLDPLRPSDPKRYMVYLVTSAGNIGNIQVDGVTIPATNYTVFDAAPNVAYVSWQISQNPSHYHTVESSGDGFVGMVYALTEAQGYLYTLGYTPDPYQDSLFVSNEGNIMSAKSYDVTPRLEEGWYQRQWNEWKLNHERLDTAQVCEGDTVKWTFQTPLPKNAQFVDWYLYDVTGTEQTINKAYTNLEESKLNAQMDEEKNGNKLFRWNHQFVLPDESYLPPEDRTPMMEYELQVVVHKQHIICEELEDNIDTLRTTVRVTRIYHDTVYQYICMGDSYEFFNDSFPNQGDLTQKGTTKSVTTFIADKTDGESTTDYEWKARLGENIYDRAYQTIYGCDSTYTLYLFVCDTFRRVDTLHLCDNQSLVYEGEKFKGILSPDADGTIVTKDTVAIIYDKTTYCPCKQNPKYPAFQGCDSIFELHLMLHKTYRDTVIDTMCYNTKPDSLYRWPIQYNTRDSLISKNHPNMVFNDDLQAWVGFFSDTLQTQTCPGCNNGNGCDSINILQLIIPKSYYYNDKDSICEWTYDRDTRTKIPNVYQWIHHRNGAGYVELPTSGTYYDSCVTRFGCDSIYTLELKYLKPFLKVDKHVMATNQTYKWHGVTYGPFLEEEFKNLEDGDTTLYFHNDNENQVHPVNGCDSIYRLELTLMDTYLFRSYRTICDYDSVHWRDTIIVGSKWQGTDPFDIRLKKTTTHVFDSLKTVELPVRDSVYQLTVTMRPSYEHFDTLYVCDNDSLEWEGQWYQGTGGTRDDERHYDTKYHCDSAFYLHLIVKPSYHFPVEDSLVCQNDPFVWTKHTHIHIPTDQPGEYFYYDSCLTTTCPACEGGGCDSIYTLHLVVAPIYDFYEEKDLCENDTLEWEGMLFVGSQYAAYGKTYDPAPYDSVRGPLAHGIHHENVYRHTVAGCDSIFHLTLTIHEVAHTDTIDSVCQGSPFFNPNWNWGQGRYMETSRVGTYTSVDTIHSVVTGCDSIVTLTLRVDSVYDYTQNLGAFCQDTINTMREWIDDEGHSHGFVLDVSTTGLHTLGETHTTIHGCDSIYGVSWYVNPIYDFYEEKDLCENDTLEWEGMLFVGSQYAAYGKTYDPAPYDSVRGPLAHGIHHENVYRHTIAGCDSIFHLTLTIHEVAHTDSLDSVCQGSPFFNPNWNWGQGRYMETGRVGTYTSVDTIHSVVTGCDSIVTLTLRVDSVYNYTSQQVVCQEYNTDWIWYENGVPQDTISLDKGDTTYVLGRVYHTIHGCDSMYGKSVYVAPIYHIYDTVTLCSNDSLHWQGMLFTGDEYTNYGRTYVTSDFDSVKVNLAANEYDYAIRRGTAAYSCDSVHHLHLTVNAVGRETIERRACQSEGTYYYEHLNNGVGGYLNAAHLSDALTRKDTIQTALGCDSIITLNYFVDSVYNYTSQQVVCQEYNTDWIWYENGVPQDTISLDKGDTTYVLGRVYHTIHGCDSTYGKSVYVAPIYHIYDTLTLCESDSLSWQGILFTGREFANYNPNGYDATHYRRVQTGLAGQANYYTDTAQYYTVHACDSVYHLALRVNTVYRASTERRVCQSEGTYFYEYLNNGVGGYLPAVHLSDALTRNDTMLTALGCDSIVTLHYFVDSVYDYRQTQYVCQDTINSLWEWIDDEGHSHGFINIADSGNYSFDEPHTTIHGCDSTYGLILRVKPIYRFDSAYVICENERMVWQGRQYTGDSVHDATLNDSIFLTVGLHYDTAHYTTVEGCDSTYYVQIRVNPVFDTTSYMHTCYNETFVWHQQDIDGLYDDPMWDAQEMDTIFISAEMAVQQQIERDTTMRYYERMLHTVNGCDSLSRLRLTIHPTYFFYTDTSVCANDVVEYRGKLFSHEDTTYTDTLHTAFGCDSIFQLHMHVRPAYLFHRYRDICDNETLYLEDNGLDIVWQPGDRIPGPRDYVEFPGKTREGCDSSYFYHVTVHPTHYFESYDTVCSSQLMLLQGSHYVGLDTIYDVLTHQEPLDIVYTDSLHTSTCPYCENQVGCDSIYRIYAHILPQYYHLDRDTICDNEVLTWRAHTYEGLQPGDYITIDSLTTKAGCDSVYELRLHVAPTYYFEDHITKCADEDLTWRAHNLDHIEAGDHLIYDSLHTEYFGCDSVYHLYLTVLDTTFEIIYDTICRTESYDFHGRMLMEPGDYKDTTTNAWGCHHFTYLHLEVIEPTVPTAWADSICADDSAYELFYTYTGRDPIGFSVYYDEEGHYYGFVDQIDIPITTEEELHMLTLPMPFRGNDITNYPKPDYYNIRLVLDNGICTNPDLCATDTNIVLSYPSWLTQQRFGDVIALYNEKYNGGYYWDAYQWYHGDELLVGETHEYLYIPTGLIVGDQYHVRLTRVGETVDFQTCPITIVGDPIADDFAPQMGYLSVVPTCIVTGHPYANILSRKDGTYRISNSNGLLVSEGVFRADVTQVELPAVPGMYIFQLWSADTPEEPYRSIKVIVKEVCENCNMPF